MDLLEKLDAIKEEIEKKFGSDDPQELRTVITPLSRLEERFHLFRQSVEEVTTTES